MPSYKLQYFDGKGRAELARLLFAAAGKEYEDERLGGETWLAAKPNTPYGQLPVLVVDKVQINQSGAIFRYLARELGFYGNNNMENTRCDVVLETISDLITDMVKVMFEKDEEKKAEQGKNMKEVSLPKFLTFFAKTLKDNGGKYLVGSALTVADIAFFDIMDRVVSDPIFGEATWKGYSELEGLSQRVKSLPNIQKWLEKRPQTSF